MARTKASGKSTKSKTEKKEEPSFSTAFEYETDDGLKLKIDPTELEIAREYELSEQDAIELSYGIDWSPVDFNVEKKGVDLSVSGEIGIPGDVLGVSGGLTLDLGTGEVKGGEIGVEFGTVDIEVSVEGEEGCRKSITVGFVGVGISYTRDDCEDDEEDEENEEDRRKPTGDDTLSGPDAEGVIDDIRRKIQERGGCSGIVRFRLHDHWLINSEVVTDEFFINLSTGIFTSDYASDRNDPDEGQYFQDFVFKDSLPYCGPFGCSYMYILGTSGRERFNTCMDNLYDESTTKTQKKIPPSPPPFNTRNMDKCCRESIKMIREIHKVLDAREVLDAGLKAPNRLIATKAKGSSTLKTYLDIIAFQIRMQDHLGIHPVDVEIRDINKSKEGDQTYEAEAVNATAILKQLLENSIENKGDSADRLGILVRTAWINIQILSAVTKGVRGVQGLMEWLGMPIKEKVDQVEMPFDPTLGARDKVVKARKGFDPSKKAEEKPTSKELTETLDLKDEDSLETILPRFLNTTEQPVLTEIYNENSGLNLIDIVKQILRK
ncbi:MAG: hypothetical protein AAFO04_24050 [Cyanobacteria bacterium J06592_8]